jgi:cell wall-associated NlpC family hydrolase
MHFISKSLSSLCLMCNCALVWAVEVPIEDFPIQNYSQSVSDYIPSTHRNGDLLLVDPEYQAVQLRQLINHYYDTNALGLSPWNEQMVNKIIPLVRTFELNLLEEYNNQNLPAAKRHYSFNFKPHDEQWFNQIKLRMNIQSMESMTYSNKKRAIAVENTYARALPDDAPDFNHFTIAGQGFPFDNLQESAIWAGTPLYEFSVSADGAWSLVLTPDGYFAWVKHNDIAYVSNGFIHHWQEAAKNGMVAITKTGVSLFDKQAQFRFKGYIGAVFPLGKREGNQLTILIPSKNSHQQAGTETATVNDEAGAVMPLRATPLEMAKIIKQLQLRPYGWGGLNLFNDCSQELKSIFTPFGIWLPRNSTKQALLSSAVDYSQEKDVDKRIEILKNNGHPLMTLIYVGGHIMLYVGDKVIDGRSDPITYQNVWGLSALNMDKRYIIGQAVFLPLMKFYPNFSDVNSQANKTYFKLINLDELSGQLETPTSFVGRYLINPVVTSWIKGE